MNSKLTLLWGLLILIVAGILFYFSENSYTSAFYVIISAFCGIFLMIFSKDIPLFSPVLMLFSSIFINISFPALYFLKTGTPFSEELLQNVSALYLIYCFALIVPVFLVNRIFLGTPKYENLLKINFNPKNLNHYFIFSNLLLVFLIIFLLKITDFSYISALKNPLAFRFAASAGGLAYIRKFVILLFMVNTFILAKYNFLERGSKFKVWGIFHIIFLLAFAVISGSRSVILLPVVSSIAIYTFYNKIKLKNILFTSIIFIVTLGLISFYASYRNHSEPNNSNVINRLDSFKNSLYFFDYIDRDYNTIFYFKDFHLPEQVKDHILQPFPRNLIPDKGYYFSSLMTGKVFNFDLNDYKVTYNFGGISNAFWNFGVSGIILEGLMLGMLVVWLHKKFLQFINYDSFFLFFMTTFFFIPNSIIVDGFWNTMDACGYFMNLLVALVIVRILSFSR